MREGNSHLRLNVAVVLTRDKKFAADHNCVVLFLALLQRSVDIALGSRSRGDEALRFDRLLDAQDGGKRLVLDLHLGIFVSTCGSLVRQG